MTRKKQERPTSTREISLIWAQQIRRNTHVNGLNRKCGKEESGHLGELGILVGDADEDTLELCVEVWVY